MRSQKSALIVKLGQIGDVIMAIPAAYALHRQGFKIDWVCGQAVESLLRCYSWINPISVDDKGMQFGGRIQRAEALWAAWKKLAFRRVDLCAVLYYDRRYRILAAPVRSKRKIWFSKASRSCDMLPNRHPADEYMRLLLETEDGFLEQTAHPVLPDQLPPSPLSSPCGRRRVAIVPGGVRQLVHEEASRPANDQALRRWPVENFAKIGAEMASRGWEVVLLGGQEDSWTRPYLNEFETTDCIGKLSLPEVISVCNTCDAIVTSDTGPLHLAGLSSTIILGIFGPTDPATRIPRRDFSVGLWGGLDFACRPCYDGRKFAPCRFNGCMHKVTPEAVTRELDRLLLAKSQERREHWRAFFSEETSQLPPASSGI